MLWYPDQRNKPEMFGNINARRFDSVLVPLILSGPLRNPRTLEDAEVDSKKLGRILCGGVRGALSVEKASNKPAAKCELQNRLHAKSAFGVVTADYTIRESEDAVPSQLHLELIDFGKGAISTLPEKGED